MLSFDAPFADWLFDSLQVYGDATVRPPTAFASLSPAALTNLSQHLRVFSDRTRIHHRP